MMVGNKLRQPLSFVVRFSALIVGTMGANDRAGYRARSVCACVCSCVACVCLSIGTYG